LFGSLRQTHSPGLELLHLRLPVFFIFILSVLAFSFFLKVLLRYSPRPPLSTLCTVALSPFFPNFHWCRNCFNPVFFFPELATPQFGSFFKTPFPFLPPFSLVSRVSFFLTYLLKTMYTIFPAPLRCLLVHISPPFYTCGVSPPPKPPNDFLSNNGTPPPFHNPDR